ncbi:helix-turn-helix transcriptional regulator [Rhodobacter sp. NSM]|uniref:helix-turn-helix transcriptional regulator n=1 Tax=Rhodobacter sp. NSM TaxID=3457501 RepID=UPI003FCF04EE
MSFAKAADLLRLAEMAASRHIGVGLQEIEEEFAVDRRTAQRMTRALEDCFPNVETRTDDQRRKFWKLKGEEARLMLARGIRDSELAAVEMSIRRAEREGEVLEAAALRSLRDRLLSGMPGTHARRAEADAEAVLEAHGFASRPGPRVRSDPQILAVVAEALKGPHLLTISYIGGRDDFARERRIEPHGLLLGTRRYLVARESGGDGRMRHFRMDRVLAARLEPDSFLRDPAFDLETHAARAFGSYHAEEEFSEVVWRFSAKAAPIAREFLFHPDQQITEEEDGRLSVRFTASGWLEMAWHLYQWGDAVEVLQPPALRAMIEGHRRPDFDAFP